MNPDETPPLVSVGVPTYNRPELLARALDCLVNQTYRNLEIIISDNASTDHLVGVVAKRYCARDGRITYFRQPQNIGVARNFAFLLEQAKGEYFMWAADDDEWTPDFVECGLAHIGDAGTVMGDVDTVFHMRGEIVKSLMPNLDPRRPTFLNARAFLENMQPSIFYGLHKIECIRSCMTVDTFDFLDCFLVYRMVIRYGVKTIGGVRYRAGVDTSDYEIKTCDQVTGRLHYLPFALAALRETWGSTKISLSEKFYLSFQIIRVIFSLHRHHDSARLRWIYSPIEVGIRRLRTLRGIISGISGKLGDSFPKRSARTSYSQAGEDMIVDFIFKALRVSKPSYLDIGAHHPFRFSNTFYFYCDGCRGVTVEPDPTLHRQLCNKRPKDVHLNVGVGEASAPSLPFYVMSTKTLNSFSKEEAERNQATGMHRIEEVLNVSVVSIGEVLDLHFPDRSPDFISVDVEGLDFQIIRSIDFSRCRPSVVCVETLTFSENRTETKVSEIIDYMYSQGYFVYADTYINSIFVDREKWLAR